MKMSRVFLVLGFVVIMALYSDSQPFGPQSEICCFNFYPGKIPAENIVDVKKTGSDCPKQGFIVTTVNSPGLCVREVTVKGQET
ncbi:C-C motif chemokine 18-like isoform X2 [Hemibagrus wyckioides]|uniref:C-C motif chemokine 18-like isoform X2 n=1 Tax=Hemibagrus wyckioides TaxID=337641 RepID=UPI00266D8314|nr:C-C motif chemokine 18-like isoform X2 [Hemibagrus wyckioides]